MSKMVQSFLAILLAGLLSCNSKPNNTETNPATASVMPEVKLSDLQGNPIHLTDYKGRVVFLNFWATWCKPCLQEMPSIANAQKILASQQVAFLLASPETKDAINEFRASPNTGLSLVQLANPEELNLVGLPTTYIYDADGKLVFSEIGYRKWDSPENLAIISTANHTK